MAQVLLQRSEDVSFLSWVEYHNVPTSKHKAKSPRYQAIGAACRNSNNVARKAAPYFLIVSFTRLLPIDGGGIRRRNFVLLSIAAIFEHDWIARTDNDLGWPSDIHAHNLI